MLLIDSGSRPVCICMFIDVGSLPFVSDGDDGWDSSVTSLSTSSKIIGQEQLTSEPEMQRRPVIVVNKHLEPLTCFWVIFPPAETSLLVQAPSSFRC